MESTENRRRSAASFIELWSDSLESSENTVLEFIMNKSSAHSRAKSDPEMEDVVRRTFPFIFTFMSSSARRV